MKLKKPRIAVLQGGVSREREVSLGSGAAAAQSLAKKFDVDVFDVTAEDALPFGLEASQHVVFSTLHGRFGEDGQMQRLLDAAGVHYAGCDATASALTFDKAATKRAVEAVGVPTATGLLVEEGAHPDAGEIVRILGDSIVLKPVDEGSSVGLMFAEGEGELQSCLAECGSGRWLLESCVSGAEVTVGVLQGEALGVVEVRPREGRFDYRSKYTKGLTEYLAPAELAETVQEHIRNLATRAFAACGCRDFARIDFMVRDRKEPVFLEVNTLPGLKETSLLPMSASLCGYNFDELLQKLVEPALLRYRSS